jgi:hypothetical protein
MGEFFNKLILVFLLFLLVAIAGCSFSIYPLNMPLVERAIYRQFAPIQGGISEQLSWQLKGFQVGNVKITTLESLLIDNLPSYHLRGNYNLKVNLPQRKYEEKNHPFDLYIQQQREGKSWRLAVPQDENQHSWLTYLLE